MNKRARKRLRQQQEAEEAKRRYRFATLAGETLRDHAFDELGYAVVDVEVIADLDGRPDDMWAWLIFQTSEEAEAARDAETAPTLEAHARKLLGSRGVPAQALPTFRLGYTSLREIEAGGGRSYFFR